jgi:hypothetical protein
VVQGRPATRKGPAGVGWAIRRGSVAGWKSDNFTGKVTKSEKFKHKSEKFKPKVRNSRVRAGKVRNSNIKVRTEIIQYLY